MGSVLNCCIMAEGQASSVSGRSIAAVMHQISTGPYSTQLGSLTQKVG